MARSDAMWAVFIMSAVTLILRFAPFAIFSGGRKTPKIIARLGKTLPCAVMGMLVVFCLKDTSLASRGGFIPQLLASALVVLTYLWRKNSLLSIIAGTALYMLLI